VLEDSSIAIRAVQACPYQTHGRGHDGRSKAGWRLGRAHVTSTRAWCGRRGGGHQGFHRKLYIVEQGARVVTVRSGGIVTAMVRTTDGLADVFGLVFDNTQTVEVLVRSGWCMRGIS
jgi:hypothetical protein